MKKAKIILLTGQSNAVGVGHCKYLPDYFAPEKVAEYRAGYPDVQINYYSHDKKSNGFVTTGLNCTELTKDTFGPEVGMAEVLTKRYPGQQFFIVKCAYGGSCLWHDWISPSCGEAYRAEAHDDAAVAEHYRDFGWCYNELMKILPESIGLLESKGYEPEIIAWCWMQGEGDADIPEHVAQYDALYQTMLDDIHAEFGQYFAKDCVYVDGGISEIWTLYKEINEIKKARAQTHANTYYIDTIGAGLTTLREPVEEPDIYHYDAGSTIKLGHLFAEHI
ncbi:MAG: hypothetical protein IJW70_04605 [Clostridia bacterium]|nr:hypothetical protein [Clostridia bacterium]